MLRENVAAQKPIKSLFAALAATFVLVSSQARSAPPPPPKQADLKSLQSYIAGLNRGIPELYQEAIAEDVKVIVDGQLEARSKSQWMGSVLARFTQGYNQNVTVENVYYGFVCQKTGQCTSEAILIERVDRISGDCCVFHRVEDLTFRDGLVASINRSSELDLRLKPDGHREDGLPGAP